eukprot:g66141.t1
MRFAVFFVSTLLYFPNSAGFAVATTLTKTNGLNLEVMEHRPRRARQQPEHQEGEHEPAQPALPVQPEPVQPVQPAQPAQQAQQVQMNELEAGVRRMSVRAELGIKKGAKKGSRVGRPAGSVAVPIVSQFPYYYVLNKEGGYANFWSENAEGRTAVELHRYNSEMKAGQVPDYRIAVYTNNSVRLFRLMDNVVRISAYHDLDILTIYKAYLRDPEPEA